MNLGAPELLHGNHLADGGLDHRGTAKEGIGHLVDHDRLTGQIYYVCAAGSVPARTEGVLFEPFGGHPAHVKKEAAKLSPAGEYAGLHGQKSARRIGDVNARNARLVGNILRPQVFLRIDRIIGAGLYATVVTDHHDPVAVNFSQAGRQTGAGDVFCGLIIDSETGAPA